jgi:hypothetical protein
MNCLYFNVNTFGIPMCAQLPVTYNLWEGPENDWITVETCSPIVISKNKCCADVKTDLFIPTPCQSLYFPLATSGLQPPAHSACHFCSLSLGYHYQQHLYERQLERNIRKYYGRGGRVKHGGNCGGGPHILTLSRPILPGYVTNLIGLHIVPFLFSPKTKPSDRKHLNLE